MGANVNEARRAFLKAGALAGGGFVIGYCVPGASTLAEGAVAAEPSAPITMNPFIKIGSDNTITILVSQSEMGQGVLTSLPMLVCEELEADWSQVKVEQAPADPIYVNPRWQGFAARGGFQATTGSSAIRNHGTVARPAGAAARQMLVAAAAETWGVPASECVAARGMVVHPASHRRATYGELASKAAKMPVPKDVVLKKPGEFKLVGTSVPRTDTPSKVNGSAIFGIDVRVPDMLVATVVHCPVVGGKLTSFDAASAKSVKGVRDVVQVSTGVAVVAGDFWTAKKGADALKVVWNEGEYAKLNSADIRKTQAELAKQTGKVRRNDGDANKVLGEASGKKVESVYLAPFLDPACMEPLNATAHWKGDSVEIWAPTQTQSATQQAVMDQYGLLREKVAIHTTLLGGGFGRKCYTDFVMEAVETSKAVGKPVKVVWTREQDMTHSFYRPATYNELSAALGPDGMPVAWKHHIVGPSIVSYFLPFGHLLKDGMDPTSVGGSGDVFQYAIPNVYVDYILHNPGVPVGFWRSVGNSQNGFIVESFIDELAHAAGKDPYLYRRALLEKQPRFLGVLDLAAEKSGWKTPPPPGVHRGIATAWSYGSHVAEVAEVSVAKDGAIKVHRVVVAIDPGWVVNPDIVRAQMESGVLYGISGALFGEITVKDGRIEQSNFHQYPLPRITDMPKIEVHILEGQGEQGGCGEPGVPSAAPAVCNAIFAATGKRIRSLPVNRDLLKT